MQGAISGSFRKFYWKICLTHRVFERHGITILSPHKSKVILNPGESWAILEISDMSPEELQARHLEAIAASDFLYVVNPRGYAGEGVRQDVEYAHAKNISIYCSHSIEDKILQGYVLQVGSPKDIAALLKTAAPARDRPS